MGGGSQAQELATSHIGGSGGTQAQGPATSHIGGRGGASGRQGGGSSQLLFLSHPITSRYP